MPKRVCEVTGDNDPEERWIPIEATSVFDAAVRYYGTVCALMGPAGVPRPTPETIFQVRSDGRVYRLQAKRALAWGAQSATGRSVSVLRIEAG